MGFQRKSRVVLALSLLFAPAWSRLGQTQLMTGREVYEQQFQAWMKEHNMSFSGSEYQKRLDIFAHNSDVIQRHNTANDGATYTLGHNEFSHLSWEEFKGSFLGFRKSKGSNQLLHSQEHYKTHFESWMNQFQTTYSDQEYQHRLDIFARNSDVIERHNAKGESWTMGHNQFSAMTENEFKNMHSGFVPELDLAAPPAAPAQMIARRLQEMTELPELPDAVDWVAKGAVTTVKNQGMCGSCWAFSAVGALEGATYLSTGQLVDLSEEQLLDCDKTDKACRGGEMESAFDWIKENGGLCLAEDYPYQGLLPPFKKCKTECQVVEGTKVVSWVKADADQKSLMAAVAKGPVAIAIDAEKMAFQLYKSGVFNGECGTSLDHGVLLVGYGTDEETGMDYWKVKNSWGPTWGDAGYIKVQRGLGEADGGECGILMDATYPVLEKKSVAAVDAVARTPAEGHDCGGGTILFQHVTVDPVEPKKGSPVSMSATGIARKPTASGTYQLNVVHEGTRLYGHKGSVCGEEKATLPLGLGHIHLHGFTCPLMPGPATYGVDVSLPSIAPGGAYVISFTAVDQDGTSLLCLDLNLDL